MAQTPVGTESVPASNFINETYCFNLDLSLTGDPGYGPYYRIMLPPDVTLKSVSFLGTSLTTVKVGAFPDGVPALNDPISGTSVTASDGAVSGDTLYVLSYPVGSLVSTTPDLTFAVCVEFLDGATLDSNYVYKFQPGLQYGDTPTGDNGPIFGTTITANSKPTLVTFTKTNNAPESERAPGSSWPFTYTLNVDIAAGKTLTAISLTDVLPEEVEFVGDIVDGACTATYTAGTRTLSATCPTTVGTSGNEISISFDVHIKDILDETVCEDSIISNSADFTAMYGLVAINPDSARDVVTAKHMPIQSNASPTNVKPDDKVTYTSSFQVSDFDSNPIDAAVITETLPAGIAYDAGFQPTISIDAGAAQNITPVITVNGDNTTTLVFDVHAVSGNISNGSEGTLTFRGDVLQHYNPPTNDDPLLANDALGKPTSLAYDLLGKASGCGDNSSAGVSIQSSSPNLSLFNSPGDPSCWVPSEVITFKLTVTVPSGDTENLTFINFFPLPVFDVSEVDTDNFGNGFDIRLASDHTDPSFVPLTADITKSTAGNSLQILWPDLEGTTVSKTVSVLVDIPIDYQPFADGLALSDLFYYSTTNSDGDVISDVQVQYLNICSPDISVAKGVSATSGDGTITPASPAVPNVSTISEADAGDEITFVLTAINSGGARAYDLVIKDDAPASLTNCSMIATDPVKYGDGTAVGVGLYSGNPFDVNGLTLDSLYASGDASKRDTVTITCTCDIAATVAPNDSFFNGISAAWQAIPETEQPLADPFEEVLDSVQISIDRPTLAKTHTSISPNGSGNANILVPGDTVVYQLTVTLPEGTTPSLSLADTLPEGLAYVASSVVVNSSAFNGTVSSSPTVGTSGTGAAGSPQTVTFDMGSPSNSDDNVNTNDAFLLSFEAVVLDDPANDGLPTAQSKTNQSQLTYTDIVGADIVATDAVTLTEPELNITLDLSTPSQGDAGDQITVTMTVSNTGTAPAYDITASNNLDGLSDFLNLSSLSNTTTLGDWTFDGLAGSTVSYSLNGATGLAAGASKVLTFTIDLDSNVEPNTTYNNQASVSGDSEPGSAPEQRTTTDSASDNISTSDPSISKSLNAVSPDGTGTAGTNVTAGDTITYHLTVDLTEGTTTDLVLTDALPAGFEYVSYVVDNTGFNGTVSSSPTVATSGTVAAGRTVTFTFSGATTVVGDNNAANNDFIVAMKAVVMDDNANDGEDATQAKTNTVTLTSNSISGSSISDTDVVPFAEPKVTINKVLSSNTGDAGDVITVELRVRNNGTATAHDIVATDILDGNVFDLSTVTLVNADGFNYSYSNPTVTFTKSTLTVAEGRRDLEFTVQIKSGVNSGTSFDNVGTVVATTQAGTTAPEERSSSRQNTETLTTTGIPLLAKTLISSTDVNTGATEAGIGEILTYQIALTVPEGTTLEDGSNPILTDTLPVGFQYLDATYTGGSHSARISAVADFNGGEISTSVAGTIDGTPAVLVPSVSGNVASGQILGFDLGDITNNDDQVVSDADAEQLIITYEVLVLNNSDNNAGDSKTNTVGLQYQDGDANPISDSDAITLTLKEPDLGVTTSAAPAGGSASGMETVTFTTKFFNSNSTHSATGYNLALSDDLPATFFGTSANAGQQPNLSSATYSGDGSDISACFEFGGDGNELIFDATNGGCTLDSLDPGDTITVVYTAVIDSLAEANSDLINDVRGSITSLDGAAGNTSSGSNTANTAGDADGERTGSAVGSNDLNVATSTTITLDEPTMAKTGDANLAVGDSTIMNLTISVPGGTMQSFTITDNLPAGLKYTGDEVSITLPTGVFADTPSPSTAADDDPVIWNFGTLTNQNSTSQDITISYEVEVRNLLANQAATTLDNDAAISFTGSSGADSLSSSATVTVIEPNLTIEMSDGGGNYAVGGTIPYTIRIINGPGGATAYGVNFANVLPPELLGGSSPFYDNIVVSNTSGSVVQTGTGTAISASDISLGTATNTGDQLSFAAFDIPAGDTLLLTFDATVINTAGANADLTLNSTADYNSLLNDDIRGRDGSTPSSDDDNDTDLNNYNEAGTVTTTLAGTPAIVKRLSATHATNDFTIGDDVIYELKVFIPEGVVGSVVVVDSLVDGLGFLSVSESSPGNFSYGTMTDDGVVGNAGKISFTFGNVTNTADGDATNDTITVTLTAQVLDDATNIQAGFSKGNLSYVTSAINSAIYSNNLSIDIIEPNLVVGITPNNATPALGEPVTFTVTVNNTGGATAHDIALASLLDDLDMTYLGSSFNANGSGFSIDDADTDSLAFTLGSLTPGGNVSFTFVATVDDDAILGTAITPSIGLSDSYDTQPGDPAGAFVERHYDVSTSTTVTPALNAIDATKTVAYVDGNTNDQLDAGEVLTYTIVLTNNTGATVNNVVFTDNIPDNTTSLSNITTTAGVSSNSTASLVQVDGFNMTNGASVTITFDVSVSGGTTDGTLIRNQGSVDSDETEPEPTDVDGVDANGDQPTDIIVGPEPEVVNDLYAQKTVSWLTDNSTADEVGTTDIMRYTFILENRGAEQLTTVSLTDVIPTGLGLSAAGTPTEGSLSTASYPTINWTGVTLEVGEVASVTLDVVINSVTGTSETFTNQGSADSDQTDPTETDSNGDPSDGNQETVFVAVDGATAAPALDAEKRWALTDDTDNDGLVDPSDSYTYTITVINTGSATASNAQFSDAAPTNTVLVSGSVTTSQGTVTSATSGDISVNLGPIEPGGVATVSFSVTPSGASDGDLIPNQASITSPDVNSGTPTLSDDNANDDDGINPTQTPIHTGSGTLDAADLSKSLSATSEGGSSGTDVLIGEVLTYAINIEVPKGNLKEAFLIDSLPAGLRYVASSAQLSRTFNTGLNSATNPGGINSATSGNNVSLTDGTDITIASNRFISLFLGDIINTDTDGTAEAYTLSLQAVVSNESGISNDAGQSLSNDGTFQYLDGALAEQTLSTSSDPTVTIREAAIGIQKAGSSSYILTAGGTLEYTLKVFNSATANTATAYNVIVTDTIPFGAQKYESLSNIAFSSTTNVGNETDNSDAGNGIVSFAIDSIAPGDTAYVTFRAAADGIPELKTDADSLDNKAWARMSSLPGTQGTSSATPGNPGDINGERVYDGSHGDSDYTADATHELTVMDLDLTKSILNPPSPNNYNIGDTVEYQVQLVVPNNVVLNNTDNLFADVLDAGLDYLTGSLNQSPVPVYAGITDNSPIEFSDPTAQTLNLNLGNIDNQTGSAQTIILSYDAVVRNVIGNQYDAGLNSGTELDNVVGLTFDNPVHPDAPFSDVIRDSATVEVGEPHLDIANTILTSSHEPGDQVDFQLVITNDGTETAYDVALADVATAYLQNINSLTVTGTTGGAETPSFTNNGDSWTSGDFDIPPGGTVTITFSADINQFAPSGNIPPNTVTASFSGQPTGATVVRDGTDGGEQDNNATLNNYVLSADPTTPLVIFPVELLNFSAAWEKGKEKDALLEWNTASEFNNDYFIVERSYNLNEWSDVIKVEGAGTSQQTRYYTTKDQDAAALPFDEYVYYRLRQVDFDGVFSYSDVIQLNRLNTQYNVEFGPNPFQSELSISSNRAKKIMQIQLFDVRGSEIAIPVERRLSEGEVEIAGLGNLPEGYYYLEVTFEDGYKQSFKLQREN
ncbi:MAG: isopeptide-forming domain-containing fimbrial protein [Bacteroidota bacterium]